jgi:hypothetical protein
MDLPSKITLDKPDFNEIKIGNNSTISISKIKKIIANKKNRIEKGIRAVFIGSNPHSKGDLFSRSLTLVLDKTQPNPITNTERKIENAPPNKDLNI